jgi:hypothetical protein
MKGSAITGPVGKEAAELWPVSQRRSCSESYLTSYSVSPQTLVSSCKGSFLRGSWQGFMSLSMNIASAQLVSRSMTQIGM